MPAEDSPKKVLSDNEEEEEDEEDEEDEEEANWYPGDGVCPPTSEFNATYNAVFSLWSSAARTQAHRNDSDPLYIESFLDLLKDVPKFLDQPPPDFNFSGVSKRVGVLNYCLELGTTEDPTCDQPVKLIDYIQFGGLKEIETVKPSTEPEDNIFSINSLQTDANQLTTIALAWSYILSCRWVEILQRAGLNATLRHDGPGELTDQFWDLVVESRWEARMQVGDTTRYSPWTLRTLEKADMSGDMVPVRPDSSVAFNILLEFCTSEGIEEDFLSGLVIILMLSSPTSLRRRLMAPIPITKRAKPLNRPAVFERLFQSLDRCLTLSATFNAIDSVLCSAFFDPNIPCNLLGAKRLAIKHALRLERKTIDYGKLLNAISAIAPHLAILWRGAICSGLAPSLFQQGNSDAPGPMSVAAFWTGKLHSFVQVTYQSSKPDASSLIPRSYEFSLTFFCRPKVRAPFPTAPPFGWTTVSNLSLELHEHYGHAHKPLWWRCNWHTHPGTLVPMSSKHHVTKVVCSMPEFSTSQGSQLILEPKDQKEAELFSLWATSGVFGWQRLHDDGLWLDDGTAKNIEEIRHLQQHQWIKDPWDTDEERVSEIKLPVVDWERIFAWCKGLE